MGVQVPEREPVPERHLGPGPLHVQPPLRLAGRPLQPHPHRPLHEEGQLHRRVGHRRLRDLRVQHLRADLHQLLQREAAAVLQPPHVRARAGGKYHVIFFWQSSHNQKIPCKKNNQKRTFGAFCLAKDSITSTFYGLF